MQKHKLIAAGTVLVAGLTAAPALATASGPTVSLRVEGLASTVQAAKSVALPASGSITKGGVAAGLCPADSAQGALAVGTAGDWSGKWFAAYKEYEVTGILGNTPNPKKDYYEIFVNNVAASAGACEITLKPGAKLLFAVVPDSGKPQTPLGVSTTVRGGKVTAKVVGYNAKGKASPLKGATLKLDGTTLRTSANGTATFSVFKGKALNQKLSLVATAPGYIRDETTVTAQSAA
jgi:hypothetical protein